LWLLLFGLFLFVLIAIAGVSYAWLYNLVGTANHKVSSAIESALKTKPGDASQPAVPQSPDAMNILVMGSDSRGSDQGRSDSLMIVHVDPSQNFLSVLSIPRDLRVNIPGHGLDKINAAYAIGGAALSITTVKAVTGIDINHFVSIDFQAFEDLTNSLGGVYVDVDRSYYNHDPNYEFINISPGYQLLQGHDALEYVRFRHDQNNDFGRIQRQQRFLSDLKQQLGSLGAGLLFKLPGLANAFFKNVATDLSANDFLKLSYWGLKLNGDRIRQLRMTGSTPTIGGVSYVVMSRSDIRSAVKEFLTAPGPGSGSTAGTASGQSSTSTKGSSSQTPSDSASGSPVNEAAWQTVANQVGFAVEAPGYVPAGYKYFGKWPENAASGTYQIKVGGGTKPAIRVMYRHGTDDQYLGVTETTWLGAPAAAKGQQVTYAGTTFTVVGTAQAADHVWWVKNGVLYWVSNTLSYLVSEPDMVRMAESFAHLAPQG
jgi:LCP family protein required for cell wall assembly